MSNNEINENTLDRIIRNLLKFSNYNVKIEGDKATIISPCGNIGELYIQIPASVWPKIERRIKIRKSYPDFDKLNMIADLIITAFGYENAIKQLRLNNETIIDPSIESSFAVLDKSILCNELVIHEIGVPPDVLIEAIIVRQCHKDNFRHHLRYCLGLPTGEEETEDDEKKENKEETDNNQN
ncbi:Hypothetical protein HVR_LOCUS1039 [uncultured virus]|nr:Hypothetical protein HVR_LOCUS1039 [uncultured virus]